MRAKFTIERIGAPESPFRYLATADDGGKIWATHAAPFDVFHTRRKAELFRAFRMGLAGEDARIVRHSVH